MKLGKTLYAAKRIPDLVGQDGGHLSKRCKSFLLIEHRLKPLASPPGKKKEKGDNPEYYKRKHCNKYLKIRLSYNTLGWIWMNGHSQAKDLLYLFVIFIHMIRSLFKFIDPFFKEPVSAHELFVKLKRKVQYEYIFAGRQS